MSTENAKGAVQDVSVPAEVPMVPVPLEVLRELVILSINTSLRNEKSRKILADWFAQIPMVPEHAASPFCTANYACEVTGRCFANALGNPKICFAPEGAPACLGKDAYRGSLVDERPPVLSPIVTIETWRNAYSNPESGEHFMGHGMVVQLLSEYLHLRKKLESDAS